MSNFWTPNESMVGELVMQEMLARLAELREFARVERPLREDVRDMLLRGADVEYGPLMARLKSYEVRKLTTTNMRNVVGDEQVEAFLRQIAPVRCNEVVIETRPRPRRRR